MFNDFYPKNCPTNWPKTVRKTGYKDQKNLPEAPPKKIEIANKPVSISSMTTLACITEHTVNALMISFWFEPKPPPGIQK